MASDFKIQIEAELVTGGLTRQLRQIDNQMRAFKKTAERSVRGIDLTAAINVRGLSTNLRVASRLVKQFSVQAVRDLKEVNNALDMSANSAEITRFSTQGIKDIEAFCDAAKECQEDINKKSAFGDITSATRDLIALLDDVGRRVQISIESNVNTQLQSNQRLQPGRRGASAVRAATDFAILGTVFKALTASTAENEVAVKKSTKTVSKFSRSLGFRGGDNVVIGKPVQAINPKAPRMSAKTGTLVKPIENATTNLLKAAKPLATAAGSLKAASKELNTKQRNILFSSTKDQKAISSGAQNKQLLKAQQLLDVQKQGLTIAGQTLAVEESKTKQILKQSISLRKGRKRRGKVADVKPKSIPPFSDSLGKPIRRNFDPIGFSLFFEKTIEGLVDIAALPFKALNKSAILAGKGFKAAGKGVAKYTREVKASAGPQAKAVAGLSMLNRPLKKLTKKFNLLKSAGLSPVMAGLTLFAGTLIKVGIGIAALGTTMANLIATQQVFARQLGTDINLFRKYGNAAEFAGGTAIGFQEVVQNISEQLGKASVDGGAAAEAISGLGLDLTELKKQDPSEAAFKIVQALSGIEDATERTFRATEIAEQFGIGFRELGLFIGGTAKELAKFNALSDRFTLQLSEADKKALEELRFTLVAIRKLTAKVSEGFGVDLAEPVTDFMNSLVLLGEELEDSPITDLLQGLGRVVVWVANILTRLAVVIVSAVNVIVGALKFLGLVIAAVFTDVTFEQAAEEFGKDIASATTSTAKALFFWGDSVDEAATKASENAAKSTKKGIKKTKDAIKAEANKPLVIDPKVKLRIGNLEKEVSRAIEKTRDSFGKLEDIIAGRLDERKSSRASTQTKQLRDRLKRQEKILQVSIDRQQKAIQSINSSLRGSATRKRGTGIIETVDLQNAEEALNSFKKSLGGKEFRDFGREIKTASSELQLLVLQKATTIKNSDIPKGAKDFAIKNLRDEYKDIFKQADLDDFALVDFLGNPEETIKIPYREYFKESAKEIKKAQADLVALKAPSAQKQQIADQQRLKQLTANVQRYRIALQELGQTEANNKRLSAGQRQRREELRSDQAAALRGIAKIRAEQATLKSPSEIFAENLKKQADSFKAQVKALKNNSADLNETRKTLIAERNKQAKGADLSNYDKEIDRITNKIQDVDGDLAKLGGGFEKTLADIAEGITNSLEDVTANIRQNIKNLAQERRALAEAERQWLQTQQNRILNASVRGSRQANQIAAGTTQADPAGEQFRQQRQSIQELKQQIEGDKQTRKDLIESQRSLDKTTRDLDTTFKNLSTTTVTVVTKPV